MEAVGRLAGGIAHDFNNILGGILGYVEMLVEGTTPGSPLRRYARTCLPRPIASSALVEQILWYKPQPARKRVPVELDRIVAETLELVALAVPGIRLETSLLEPRCALWGDATQLHQVIMNLCTNASSHRAARNPARDARRHGSECRTDACAIHAAPGNYAQLTVEDSGNNRGWIRATLAASSSLSSPPGSRQGRASACPWSTASSPISSGAIDVQSSVGHGSTFSIYLRAGLARRGGSEASAPVPHGNGDGFWLVDDEKALVAVTSEVLKHLGYQPVPFPDGRRPLAEFEADPERTMRSSRTK